MTDREAGNRVVVTGRGLITPLGLGAGEAFGALLAGKSGIGEIGLFDVSGLPCRRGAEIRDFAAKDHIGRANLRKMDRLSSLAASAGRLALTDAALDPAHYGPDRVGVLLGVAYGNTDLSVKMAETIFGEGPRYVNPINVPNVVLNAPAGHTSLELGLTGFNSTVHHGWASAETAILWAADTLRLGRAEAMLAGGAEVLGWLLHLALVKHGALAGSRGGPEEARPLDRDRNGYVAGEGAGVLVLETLAGARARGAAVRGELLGWGMASGKAPLNDWPEDPAGPEKALRLALADAGLEPEDIALVVASADGHPRLDALEAAALARVFPAPGPAVYCPKGALGESFSSGGIRTALALSALAAGQAPPTLGLAHPLPGVAAGPGARPLFSGAALVTGFAPGGTYVVLVLGPAPGEEEKA